MEVSGFEHRSVVFKASLIPIHAVYLWSSRELVLILKFEVSTVHRKSEELGWSIAGGSHNSKVSTKRFSLAATTKKGSESF
jgi:hypothetical protein